MRWVPFDQASWPAIAAVLPKPWPREAVAFDLRWWDVEGDRPGRPTLQARWGWGEKAVRLVVGDPESWADPRRGGRPARLVGRLPGVPVEAGMASEGPAKGQCGASQGPARGQPRASAATEQASLSPEKGQPGASEGPAKGQPGASEGPVRGQSVPDSQPAAAQLGASTDTYTETDTQTEQTKTKASGPVQPVLVAPVEVQPPAPTQSDAPLELPKPKRARPTAPLAAPSGPGLPAIPGWASSTGLPRERGTGRDLAGVVLRTVARVTGRPLPAPWGLEGEAMPGQGVRIDPEASTEATQVVRLLRALAWPDLREWEGQAEAVAAAFHRCPDRLFAHDVRAVGWPEGVDRSRDVATFVVQKRWASRVDAALRWQERQAAASAPPASAPLASVGPIELTVRVIEGPTRGTLATWRAGQEGLRDAVGGAPYDIWLRSAVAEEDGLGPLVLRVDSPLHAGFIADNFAAAIRRAAGGAVCIVA